MVDKSKRVTQVEVARVAKVSQGVVSSVLSGKVSDSLGVGEKTRIRVLQVANDLGYDMGSNSRRGRNSSTGANQVLLVMPPPHRPPPGETGSVVSLSYRSFAGHATSELSAALGEKGIGLSMHSLVSEKGLMQWLAESDVRGIIWHTHVGDGALLAWVGARFPLVIMNQSSNAAQRFDSVSVDHELNVRLPMEYLWVKGHRKIAYFGQVPGSRMFTDRLGAYRSFVEEKGVRDYYEFQEIPDEQNRPAQEKTQMILDTWERLGENAPTALVLSDVFALRILEAARRRGIRVPEELSLVGIDNVEACEYVSPRLTSVSQCIPTLCSAVVERLCRRIEDIDAPHQFVRISPHLVERDSVAELSISRSKEVSIPVKVD